MAQDPQQLEELRRLLAELTARVYRLERAIGATGVVAVAPTPVQPAAVEIPAPPPSEPAPPTQRHVVAAQAAAAGRSLEARIGSQWLNRVGIVAVLVGVSYFLKYAFENNWIGAAGRVSIGLLAGIAVVVWSERFRGRGYLVFSYSLKAVGIGVLYLSLWAAFQVYHLVPGGVAFTAMVLVTAATGLMALQQNAEVLAAFALVGGFSTPVLLSTGQNREIELFSYVAVFDLAMLALVRLRPWTRLLVGSFVGTLVLYIGWYDEFYTPAQLARTAAFATLFFAVFAAAPLVAEAAPEVERRLARQFTDGLIIITLLNAGAYFLELYSMLEHTHYAALAWSAIAIAATYLALSRPLQRRRRELAAAKTDVIYLLHLALAIGFLTIAIPLKLEAHWITIGWLVEAGVLLYLGERARSDLVRVLATVALTLGIGRLLLYDNFQPTRLIFNARFATYAVAIAVLAGVVALGRRSDAAYSTTTRAIAVVAINLLALFAFTHEVTDYFGRQLVTWRVERMGSLMVQIPRIEYRRITIARDFTYSAVWLLYGAGLMWAGFWRRSAFLRWQALLLIAVTTVKVFTYDVSQLERGYRIVSFIALGMVLLAISFIYQRDWLGLSQRRETSPPGAGSPERSVQA